MLDEDVLVFVEVRRRSSMGFGGALASIGYAKQRRMLHAAKVYLTRHGYARACRFDCVAIDGSRINWLKNILSE